VFYSVAADFVVILHLAFVLFVVGGGFLVLRWRRLWWLHVPAAAWGALVELAGWICPLTPLENSLRGLAGQAGYTGGFVDHYIMAVLYPDGLTRELQIVLGLFVLGLNALIYAVLLRRSYRAPEPRRRSIDRCSADAGRP
jgi:hypothetical protein